MKIGEKMHPIKFVFHEEAMTVSIYDMSNNGSELIISCNGHMDPEDENIFIIDEINFSDAFEYSETTEQMSGIKIIETEIPEEE